MFEAALVDHAVNLQQSLFGLITTYIRKLAFDIAEQNNLKHPFHNEKAGRGWLFGFMNRHPELSLRMPEPTSLARAVGFNKPSVDKFFNLYKNILSKESYTAQQIYNMDETGLTNVHKPGKVISKRGQRQVGKITSGEKGQTMTVICAVNAAGSYVPPMLIFKRKRMVNRLLSGSPPGTIGGTSANGWIDNELFVKWLGHFITHVNASKENRIILIVDGHSTHKSIQAIELARDNGVTLICLPPHKTHKIQPLDRTIYGPLKTNYNKECEKWMLCNAGQRITSFEQAALFGSAYVKTATMDKAISGFQCCGLWPFNPDVFSEEDFIASHLTDEPDPSTIRNPSPPKKVRNPCAVTDSFSVNPGQDPSTVTVGDPSSVNPVQDLFTVSDPSSANSGQDLSTVSDPSSANPGQDPFTVTVGDPSSLNPVQDLFTASYQSSASPGQDLSIVSDPSLVNPGQGSFAVRNSMTSGEARAKILLMSPIPKSKLMRSRTRKCESATIITSSPYRAEQLAKEEKKQRGGKQVLKQKKPVKQNNPGKQKVRKEKKQRSKQ